MQGAVHIPNLGIYMNNLLRMDDDAINFDDSNNLVFKVDGTWSSHSIPVFSTSDVRLPIGGDNNTDFQLFLSEYSL